MSSDFSTAGHQRGNGSSIRTSSKTSAVTSEDGSLYSTLYLACQIFARRTLQKWGRFVATRPITVLLLCCVFLCALTYPVLSLYAWAAPSSALGFFSFLRTSPSLRLVGADGGLSGARDRRLPWQDLESVIINGEEACWQRIPKFREVTVQQILLGFPSNGQVASEHGVLDRQPLHGLYKLQKRLLSKLANPENITSLACVQLEQGLGGDTEQSNPSTCFALSPLSYWGHDENIMLSDTSVIATINLPHESSTQLPMKHQDFFVGRVYSGKTLRKADYAVLTLFLEGAVDAAGMNTLVRGIAQDMGYVLVERSESGTRAVMKHRSEVRVRSTLWEDAVFYTGYFIVGTYIYLTLRRLDKVHSRIGLVITGIVQMLASGLMSLSLCALSGYKFNLVPVKLIPFLIVVLGVDNMFVLTSAVSNTSINLPVKERVAEGLAQSGVGIFINLLVELGLCGGLYMIVSAQVIREMAVFSAVALVVDYVMQMTYFITVLSIDMHRLELADLLQQGAGAPPGSVKTQCAPTHRLPRFLELVLSNAQGRQARTYSAIILIASNYLLYLLYGRDYFVPAFCSNINHAQGRKLSPGSPLTPSEAFWFLLGARLTEAVHIHIPPPIVLLFDSFGVKTDFLSTAKASISVLLQFVVLPISLTTLGLYALLTHLLKGTDQLNTGSGNTSENEDVQIIKTAPSIAALDQNFQDYDVELLCLSGDGTSCASWCPLEKRIRVRSLDNRRKSYSTLDLVLPEAEASEQRLRHLALDFEGRYLAAASATSQLLLWSLEASANTPCRLSRVGATSASSKITSLEPYDGFDTGSKAQNNGGRTSPPGQFVAAFDDGSLWLCTYSSSPQLREIVPPLVSEGRVKSLFGFGVDGVYHLARFGDRPYSIEVWSCPSTTQAWVQRGSVLLETTADSITAWSVYGGPDGHPLAVLGRASGIIEIWDVLESKQVFIAKFHEQSVRHIRIQYLSVAQCDICQGLTADCFLLATSDHVSLRLHRLYNANSDACDCEVTPSGNTSVVTQAPTASHNSSPSRKHGVSRTVSEDTGKNLAYPLSPHALRRMSHAAEKRKPEEIVYKEESNGLIGEANSLLTPPRRKVSSESRLEAVTPPADVEPWLYVHIGQVPLGPRDRWVTSGTRLLGVKRALQPARQGSSLSRWQAWTSSLSSIKTTIDGRLASESTTLDQLIRVGSTTPREGEPNLGILPFTHARNLLLSRSGDVAALSMGNIVFALSLHPVAGGVPLSRRASTEYG